MHSGVTVWGKAIFWHLQLTQKQHTDKRFHCEAVLPDEETSVRLERLLLLCLFGEEWKKTPHLHCCRVAGSWNAWITSENDTRLSSSRVTMVEILICLGGTTSKHICGYGFKPRAPGWHGKMHVWILGCEICLTMLYKSVNILIYSIFIIHTTVKI